MQWGRIRLDGMGSGGCFALAIPVTLQYDDVLSPTRRMLSLPRERGRRFLIAGSLEFKPSPTPDHDGVGFCSLALEIL